MTSNPVVVADQQRSFNFRIADQQSGSCNFRIADQNQTDEAQSEEAHAKTMFIQFIVQCSICVEGVWQFTFDTHIESWRSWRRDGLGVRRILSWTKFNCVSFIELFDL